MRYRFIGMCALAAASSWVPNRRRVFMANRPGMRGMSATAIGILPFTQPLGEHLGKILIIHKLTLRIFIQESCVFRVAHHPLGPAARPSSPPRAQAHDSRQKQNHQKNRHNHADREPQVHLTFQPREKPDWNHLGICVLHIVAGRPMFTADGVADARGCLSHPAAPGWCCAKSPVSFSRRFPSGLFAYPLATEPGWF